jgi:hypothetical protein
MPRQVAAPEQRQRRASQRDHGAAGGEGTSSAAWQSRHQHGAGERNGEKDNEHGLSPCRCRR